MSDEMSNRNNNNVRQEIKDPYIASKKYYLKELKVGDSQQADASIQGMMDEVGLKYNKNDAEDFRELAGLLCYQLQYPSSEMAMLHGRATKFGEYKTSQRCACCGLKQSQETPLCQFKWLAGQSQNRSIFWIGFNYTYYVCVLALLFLIYGVFAVISNNITSKTYRIDTDGALTDMSLKSYQSPVSYSFGSQQFHPTSFAMVSVHVQGWLGIVALLFFGICAKGYEEAIKHDYQGSLIQGIEAFSLQCRNFPYQKADKQLIEKLKSLIKTKVDNYMKHLGEQVSLKQDDILIKFVDYAMPLEINSSLENMKEYEKVTCQYNQMKAKLKKLLNQRIESEEFKTDKNAREKLYGQFLKIKQERNEKYMKLVKEYQSSVENNALEGPMRVDIFLTFLNNALPQLMLMAENNTPKSFKEKFNQFFENELIWVQAPAPDDIIWQNFNQSRCSRVIRFFITVSVTAVVLSVSFLALYNFQRFKLYTSANNANSKDNSILNSLISILVSLPIYMINFFIKTLFDYLSRNFEKHKTYSHMQISLGYKTVLVLLMNSALIPILVNMAYKENLYGVDGLASDVFYFALTNAILTPFMKVVNISYFFNRLGVWSSNSNSNKWSMNQYELNKKCEYLPHDAGLEYATTALIFLYTCFFAPLQPIIILFSFLGLLFSKYAHEYVLKRMTKDVIKCIEKVNVQMLNVIFFAPLLFAIGSFCWTDIYAISVPHYRLTNILMLALSTIYVLSHFYQWKILKLMLMMGDDKNHVDLIKQIESQSNCSVNITKTYGLPQQQYAYFNPYKRSVKQSAILIPYQFKRHWSGGLIKRKQLWAKYRKADDPKQIYQFLQIPSLKSDDMDFLKYGQLIDETD